MKALASLGLRDFGRAAVYADEALNRVSESAGTSVLSFQTARARVDLARGRPADAIDRLEATIGTPAPRSFEAEAMACRSLAHAALGEFGLAVDLADVAAATTHAAEVTVLVAAVRAIAAIAEGGDASGTARELIAHVGRTRNVDGFITAYRAFPRLLAFLATFKDLQVALRRITTLARDDQLARKTGLDVSRRRRRVPNDARLSPRELEIYGLLRQGLKNREIASTLFISEVTVKVHLRHVFEKLGVRSRTEAVLTGFEPPAIDETEENGTD
jgi:ATP/maltotriose-dependent transcriptional regulator MalT